MEESQAMRYIDTVIRASEDAREVALRGMTEE
jgi:hypothetical protein